MMTEFMGLLQGVYDAKAEGFLPGGASLHNCMSAHGPDAETWTRATRAELKPQKLGLAPKAERRTENVERCDQSGNCSRNRKSFS